MLVLVNSMESEENPRPSNDSTKGHVEDGWIPGRIAGIERKPGRVLVGERVVV